MVLEQGRGSLPFLLLHGEALVACASWAMGAAEVQLVDFGASWEALADGQEPVVLHDSLCPMTPPAFLASCVVTCLETGQVVVGVQDVTDTVKPVRDGRLGHTVDRDGLLVVTSPVVLPAAVVAALDDTTAPDHVEDLAAFVALLADRFAVLPVSSPPTGRRVTGAEDVRLLETLTDPR